MSDSIRTIKTGTLMNRLFKTSDLESFFNTNRDAMRLPTFGDTLAELCSAKGLTRAEVIRASDIERSYGYQLFNGTRKPSRDKALQLAIGLGLSVDEAQTLLKAARMSPLYPKIRRDAAVMFALHQGLRIQKTQELLSRLELTLLGGEDAAHG